VRCITEGICDHRVDLVKIEKVEETSDLSISYTNSYKVSISNMRGMNDCSVGSYTSIGD
jgi:hypothetical protein